MEIDEFARVVAPWSGGDGHPVGAQLGLAIRQAIASGLLAPGERLPPERAIAVALHVSRPTVSGVIDGLRCSGLVESRQGSGTWVAPGATRSGPSVPFAELVHAGAVIDLAAATSPDAGAVPPIRVDTADLLAVEPANGLGSTGLGGLRELIAARARRWTPGVGAARVVVTSGAHQALALLIATLVPRGSAVLVEEATYGGLVDLVRAHGGRPIGVPHDARGPDPGALEALMGRHDPAMVILVASVHSPTGRIADDERCAELAGVLAGHPARVVVDETYADLEFETTGRDLSRRLGERAVRVGTLSKTLWTGLRVGWLIADEAVCRDVVRRRWSQFDLGPSVPGQLFARAVMDDLDGAVDRRRAHLRATSERLIEALSRACPDWELTPPQGGLALWVRLPGGDGDAFAAAAAERGVAVLPGSACRADRAPDAHIRICFDRPPDLLYAAVDRLADVSG